MPKFLVSISNPAKSGKAGGLVDDDLASVLKFASNKLKIKAKRVFIAQTGEELTDSNFRLTSDMKLVVTKGEDYNGDGSSATAAAGDSDPVAALTAQRTGPCVVRVLTSAAHLDEEALKQLRTTAALPGMVLAVGQPDLHPGSPYPIGVAFVTRGVYYPHLIGGDIGCGMALIQTKISTRTATDKRLQRWSRALQDLDEPWRGNHNAWLTHAMTWGPGCDLGALAAGMAAPVCELDAVNSVPAFDIASVHEAGMDFEQHHQSLGTIGGGNHFAELQCIERVEDEHAFRSLGLQRDALYLMVHSGSRGLGSAVLKDHEARHGTAPLRQDSAESSRYLNLHDNACAWAQRNRALIGLRFLAALQANPQDDAEAHAADDSIASLLGDAVSGRSDGPAVAISGGVDSHTKAVSGSSDKDNHTSGGGGGGGDDISQREVSLPALSRLAGGAKCVLDIHHNNLTLQRFTAGALRTHASDDAAAASAAAVPAAAVPAACDSSSSSSSGSSSGASSGESGVASTGTNDSEALFLHRKGAAPSTKGPVVIPGSRGAMSYLVVPCGDREFAGFSLAHGAGRRWQRKKALEKGKSRFPDSADLLTTQLNSIVICDDKNLLYEEAPEAYKDIDAVVGDLVSHGLVRVVAVLRPLITYKMRNRQLS